jgi:hypothetical protein
VTRVVINPGVCGFKAIVEVTKESKRKVSINIKSDCQQIAGLSDSIKELDIWEVLKPDSDSEIRRQALVHHLHTACPVPTGILKAIEAEAGLALPRDVTIHFEIDTGEQAKC